MTDLKIQNITQCELASKKHSIFIGISVGIKPMSINIARGFLEWADEHSCDTVQILVADEIAKYNYLAFSHYTKKGCLSRALRDGDKYCALFEKAIATFPESKRNRFNIIRWKNIKSPQFFAVLKEITAEFETNDAFKQELFDVLDLYIEQRNKTTPMKNKLLLCQYLLEELPTLIDGIYVNNKKYGLMLYPTYKHSSLNGLVKDIQNNRRYQALSSRLESKKNIVIESIICDTF